MRLKPSFTACARLAAATALVGALSGYDQSLFASEQSAATAQPAPATQAPPPPQPPLAVPKLPPSQAGTGPILRLSVEEAVSLSLEQNLGIRADRLTPQIADMGVASAASAWTPNFNTRFQSQSISSPTDSFLTGTAADSAQTDRVFTTVGVSQNLKWFGGNYFVGVDGSRRETNSFFDDRNPRLDSNLNVQVVQPLLRNFKIDCLPPAVPAGEQPAGGGGPHAPSDDGDDGTQRPECVPGTWSSPWPATACRCSRSSSRRSS